MIQCRYNFNKQQYAAAKRGAAAPGVARSSPSTPRGAPRDCTEYEVAAETAKDDAARTVAQLH